MKALTVRQPWAWAIIHGGKTIENRTTNWKYRGPLAIHAGSGWSLRGAKSELVIRAHFEALRLQGWQLASDLDEAVADYMRVGLAPESAGAVRGAIIGVVELVDLHRAEPGCCDSPWGERVYTEASGKIRRSIVHLELEDPRPIEPVLCPGRLGLWDVDDDVLEEVARRERVINRA